MFWIQAVVCYHHKEAEDPSAFSCALYCHSLWRLSRAEKDWYF